MYWIAGGFIYTRVESPFHRLDPRLKLMISLELFVLSLLASSVVQVAAIISTVLLIAVLARSVKRVGKTVALSSVFAAFIFALNTLFGVGLADSLVYGFRFMAVISSTSVFFVTTSPDELEQTMKWMHVPRDMVFAFVTAVRFIPVIMLDAFQIIDAQKSRGLEVEKGNIVMRIRNTIPILIPLVVNSVIRSGELAEAMESRAYGAVTRPTSLYELRLKWYDVVVMVASIAAFVTALYIYQRISMPI